MVLLWRIPAYIRSLPRSKISRRHARLYEIRRSSEYKKSRKNAKRVMFSAKEKKQKECANDLNDSECVSAYFKV